MSYQLAATILGMLLQIGGAAYLVLQSHVTTRKLEKYKNITYGNFAEAIGDLAHELHGQFAQQLRGFIALAIGSFLQLSGAIPA